MPDRGGLVLMAPPPLGKAETLIKPIKLRDLEAYGEAPHTFH
jgi:hypothetical protein